MEKTTNLFGDLQIIHEIPADLTKDGKAYTLSALYVGSYNPETETTEAESALYAIVELESKAGFTEAMEEIDRFLTEEGEETRTDESILSFIDTGSASHTGRRLHEIIDKIIK